MRPIEIESIRIERGSAYLVARTLPEYRYTNSEIAKRVLVDFPDIAQHSCINSKGPLFSADISDTPLAHLLEHLIIDIELANPTTEHNAMFVGNTVWINEDGGVSGIHFTFADDLVALEAVSKATDYLNSILGA